jgi:hypothetical protein
VVQISDGAVQTSGASVEVSKDGGAFSAGGGTLAVSNGIHSYTPTQGETDCDSLRINVYKSGCIPATAQAVFSASASFGYAGTDQSKIANPSSTQNLSGTTIKAVTDGVTVTTNNDKTGYSLTQAFPSNFAALAITAGGAVTVGTNNDKTGYSLATAPLNATQTADAVWNALLSSYTVGGSFGARVVRSVNSNNQLQLTGSNHAAADIHELQPAVIDNTHFDAGAIDSNALAASAATEIATAVGALTQLVDLTTMIVNDGTANARFSTSALQNAPSGGGGGTGTGARTVVVTVTLSAAPVEGASVRLTKAAETYVGSTNASGQVTFNVDDGTWTVAITSPGATFAGASLVVDDNETVSYSLTAISITPSPATQITGYYTCYSHLGVVEAGVSITMQLVGLAQGSTGLALDNCLRTVTSNANGVAQFTNLFPGCRYKVYRGAAENKAWYVNLPDTATGDPVELGSIYGDDE